ncbi:SseB family protein [Methanobrevibacter sp.]|uniref:SseB family protein n=1 Tax=Methanobrevibacter sp. TaxID=66852 RepID=UPI0026E0B428|nr:SseB family protein [Methanobrevibacter sp.]MDO5859885.1 SseB family protein [Methanobrevibacter sp.]
MVNHKHLRAVVEDIHANGGMLTEDLLLKLINEFRFSNLWIPAKRQNDTLNFIIYDDEEAKITPLFTDLDEFRKFYKDTDIQALQNSFELYQNIIRTTDIEGYILNPASEKYLFTDEFILGITNIPKTNFYTSEPYTKEELKGMYDSIDNSSLEGFIKKRENVGHYEALFEELANSTCLVLMLSPNDLTAYAKDGIISMQETGPMAQMHTDRIGGEYATIFTSKEKLNEVATDYFRYAQIVNVATLVNFILSEDMDGIIINQGSDDVLIPRVELLRYSLGFEKFANDEKLSTSIFYMFPI